MGNPRESEYRMGGGEQKARHTSGGGLGTNHSLR